MSLQARADDANRPIEQQHQIEISELKELLEASEKRAQHYRVELNKLQAVRAESNRRKVRRRVAEALASKGVYTAGDVHIS